MMTVHKLSAGDGYRYYTGEVASGDVLRDKDRELGDYYTVEGMPPGQWLGSGAADLALYGNVSEEQMHALFSGQQLPLTTEELASLLAQKPDSAEAIYAKTLEEKREEYAAQAWEIHLALQQGKSQSEIISSLPQQMSQQNLSHKIQQYQKAGNPVSKVKDPRFADPDNLRLLRYEFIYNYTMTADESTHAGAAAAQAAKQNAAPTSRKNAETPHTYNTVTSPYMKKLAEEKARFIRTEDREPTKAETRDIRNRVGGELFREEHRREPRNKEELARWIASQSKPHQQTIAGFDLVFTPTKSVSIAWGLGDETLRKGIEKAHEQAIADVVSYLESNAVYTRRGMNGIAQEDVKSGIIASKFRHYDSREGDPNLHDHLVIANKVQGQDGRWLTLDGRMIYSYNVAASELYNTKIAEHIHANLGLEFVGEERKGRMIYELAGIDTETIKAYSSRSSQINKTLAELEKKFVQEHGYAPNDKARIALRQQATLATRPQKEGVHSLAELNASWQKKAKKQKLNLPVGQKLYEHLQAASTEQAAQIIEAKGQAFATSELEHAHEVIERLQATRSTWKITHVEAETQRYFRDVTSGAGMDAQKVAGTVAAVLDQSIALNNFSEPVELPAAKLRADGTSVYRRADHQLFSSHAIFDAEKSLVQAATSEMVIPVATHETFDRQVAQLKAEGGQLSSTQEAMARAFVTDERLLVVGIGPAGAGKTTSMKAAVDTAHASGHKVIALAPTAVAASIMVKELGTEAGTLASFKNPDSPLRASLSAGDVLLVDEVGMASTLDLAAILEVARENGAVVRGIGDYRQLSAIGSGGALRLIESEAGAIYLEDVFRFKNPEEAAATLAVREPPLAGADKPFDWYLENERITAGEKDTMLGDVYAGWAADTAAGKDSLMLAPTNGDVKKLNEYAQVAAIDAGVVRESKTKAVLLDDGSKAFVGDRIVTRENKYKLRLNGGKDFVKNGDLWEVKQVTRAGELKIKHTGHGGVITLPADYVKESVQLGYASTINRAQGSTVDTVHAAVDSSTTRANAYVALSRGRENNQLYVATTEDATRDDVLSSITNSFDRNLSFHEETRSARTLERNVAENLAKYEDLSLHASEEAMKTVVIKAVGEDRAASFYTAPAWGALAHELADTYRSGLDPVVTFKRAHDQRDFKDAEDLAAVMHWRIEGLRSRDEKAKARFGDDVRPMAHIPAERLELLIEKAKERTAPLKERDIEDKRWIERDYALVPSDKLKEMRVRTFKALEVAEATKDSRGYAEISENLGLMNAEVSRRRWSSPAQREVEELVRGERARNGANFTILNALEWEQKVRAGLLPEVEVPTNQDKNRIVKGVSGHSLDSFWQYDQYTPESLRRVLKAQHSHVGQLVQLRGRELAVEAPAWAGALGQVPAKARNARHWYRVAAEVESFREKYQVPVTEEKAIPKNFVKPESRAEFLDSQISDVHKRSRLSSTLKSEASLSADLVAAEGGYAAKTKLSEAEELITPLNTPDIDFAAIREQEEKKVMAAANRLAAKINNERLLSALNEANIAKGIAEKAHAQQATLEAELTAAAPEDWKHLEQAQAALHQATEDRATSRISELTQKYESLKEDYAAKYGSASTAPASTREWLETVPAYQQATAKVTVAAQKWHEAKAHLEAEKKTGTPTAPKTGRTTAAQEAAAKVRAAASLTPQDKPAQGTRFEPETPQRRGPRL